mgnify:FL=1
MDLKNRACKKDLLADIPSIDLNFDPLCEAEKNRTVLMIHEACTRTGFFSIVNHGVPEELLDHCWQASLDFFAQSASEKMKTGMPFGGYPYGFVPMEKESLSRSRGESAPRISRRVFLCDQG